VGWAIAGSPVFDPVRGYTRSGVLLSSRKWAAFLGGNEGGYGRKTDGLEGEGTTAKEVTLCLPKRKLD